jgi:hypothetical protein
LVPATGLTVSHEASSVIPQLVFEVIPKVPALPFVDPIDKLVGLTSRVKVVPIWITITVLLETPVPAIVNVALRLAEPVLALVAVTVIVPELVPATGLTVSQEASSVIPQLVFEVIPKVPALPFVDPIDKLVGLTSRVKAAPVWVIVTVLLETPVPAMVTVALLLVEPVLALVAVTVIVPPLFPAIGFTVSHEASSVIPQLVFEVIPKVPVLPFADPIDKLVGLTSKVKAAPVWVIVTVLLETPVPAIVTVALLLVEPVLALVAVTVIVPELLPATGLTVSQDASSVIPQFVFEVIPKVPVLPFADPIDTLVGLTSRVKAAPVWVTITVLLETPVPAIVTVALRLEEPVLALVAVTVIVPELLPATGLTVSQDASSVIPQLVFEVIPKVPGLPFVDPIDKLVGLTSKVKAAPVWVTITVLLETPVPAIVTVALLLVEPVLALVAVTVIVPELLPATGLTVSHEASSVIPQLVFEVIPKVPALPFAEPIDILVGVTVRVAVGVQFRAVADRVFEFVEPEVFFACI